MNPELAVVRGDKADGCAAPAFALRANLLVSKSMALVGGRNAAISVGISGILRLHG